MEETREHPKVVVGLDVGGETIAAAALRSAGESGDIKGSIANTAEGFDDLASLYLNLVAEMCKFAVK